MNQLRKPHRFRAISPQKFNFLRLERICFLLILICSRLWCSGKVLPLQAHSHSYVLVKRELYHYTIIANKLIVTKNLYVLIVKKIKFLGSNCSKTVRLQQLVPFGFLLVYDDLHEYLRLFEKYLIFCGKYVDYAVFSC